MRFYGEQTGLKDRFRAVDTLGNFAEAAKAISAPGAQKSDKQFAIEQAAKIAKDHDDIQHGLKSGSIESVHLTTAAASKEAQGSAHEKAEKEAKERADDLLLLTLMQDRIDALDKEIDFLEDQIQKLTETIDGVLDGTVDLDDALQEEHVKRAIAEWESRNPGRKFDPKSEDAEELLLTIMEEQKQLDSGNVLAAKAERAELSNAVNEADQRLAAGEPIETVRAKLESRFSDMDGYAVQQGIAVDSSPESALTVGSRGGQDEHADKSMNTDEAVSLSDDGFAGFGSLALDTASRELNSEFKVATALPESETPPDIKPDVQFDVGMKT
ncbi:hypothetical protein ACSSV1_003631 [Labrenzia sp. MBR-25]